MYGTREANTYAESNKINEQKTQMNKVSLL